MEYERKANEKSAVVKGKAEMHYEPVDIVASVKVEGKFVVVEG